METNKQSISDVCGRLWASFRWGLVLVGVLTLGACKPSYMACPESYGWDVYLQGYDYNRHRSESYKQVKQMQQDPIRVREQIKGPRK